MVHKAPLKIYARGVVSYFYFSRAPRARAENKANQQCHFKSSRWRMELLDTDSCRGTVPMEPPMSNSSMHHREPKSEIDGTGHFLHAVLEKRTVNPGTGKFSLPVLVKSTGVQLILVLPQTEKS